MLSKAYKFALLCCGIFAAGGILAVRIVSSDLLRRHQVGVGYYVPRDSIVAGTPKPIRRVVPLITFGDVQPIPPDRINTSPPSGASNISQGSLRSDARSRLIAPINFSLSEIDSDKATTTSVASGLSPRIVRSGVASSTDISPLRLTTANDDSGKVMSSPAAPEIEEKRIVEERELVAAGKPQDDMRVTNDFECATQFLHVQQVSPNHIVIGIPNRRFLFHLTGIRGKIVRIDLIHKSESDDETGHTNPLYSYATDIGNLAKDNLSSDINNVNRKAWNGASLPSTNEQTWHYISDTWLSNPGTLSLIHQFSENAAYIAMRPPCPPSYSEHVLQSLPSNDWIHLVEIGRSTENRPLQIVCVGTGDELQRRAKPCVLVYAGEHSDEPDSIWAVQGMIDFLIADSPESLQARSDFEFLLIPILDPDASAKGLHGNILSGFLVNSKQSDSILYANWFEHRVRDGGRIDVALDLHCGGIKSSAQVACALMEGNTTRGQIASGIHSAIARRLRIQGLTVDARAWLNGWSPDRLGGWLSRRYGCLTFAYEFDSQNAITHLNTQDLKNAGKSMLEGVLDSFDNGNLRLQLVANVNDRVKIRMQNANKMGKRLDTMDAITYESELSKCSPAESDKIDHSEVFVR